MTDTHAAEHHDTSGQKIYLVIFAALTGFTAVSFVVNTMVRNEALTRVTGFIIILAVAVIKAILVGTYFMHLKHDWSKLYFLIIPAMILGCLLIVVLMPDIVLAW